MINVSIFINRSFSMKSKLIILISSLWIISCEGTDEIFVSSSESFEPGSCESRVVSRGLYYEQDNNQFLWAGEDSTTHFNITNWSLNVCNLKKGLGREAFHSPHSPDYELLSKTDTHYPDDAQAVIVNFENTVKVFPLTVMTRYETVNEVIDGEPIAIVYCFLAELATVYKRNYCGETLTFAVSGYTYRDADNFDGKESFILWDRNSESLWWPIKDLSVAGAYQGQTMIKYNFGKWGLADFAKIRRIYPSALVLVTEQPLKESGTIKPLDGCS
ncbi:MAG: hypothetical protein ACJA2S_004502 [Cyclobacteriaceae bacterium]|jgi:hypothetical protein